MEIEQEPKPTAAGVPPAYWPASGSISVDNLSAKYSPDGPTVLHDVSFNIKSGQRVGVGESCCGERLFKELTWSLQWVARDRAKFVYPIRR